jgi:hypothetical protein
MSAGIDGEEEPARAAEEFPFPSFARVELVGGTAGISPAFPPHTALPGGTGGISPPLPPDLAPSVLTNSKTCISPALASPAIWLGDISSPSSSLLTAVSMVSVEISSGFGSSFLRGSSTSSSKEEGVYLGMLSLKGIYFTKMRLGKPPIKTIWMSP